jgi:L,D-transpeptidase YbiS
MHPSTAARLIRISIDEQRLQLLQAQRTELDVTVATARNGPGELRHSECTPRGWHRVRARIGAGCAANTVFVGRRPTGELYTPALRAAAPERDWILTRILWLCGLEPGRNRLGAVDTMRRYIYIHGCPDDDPMGVPSSHGCIKMRNADVIALFDRVAVGTRVLIQESPLGDTAQPGGPVSLPAGA